MFTIALVNQKGGVGKSTTAVNLSAGLARLGKRVLLIDLDPQGHATVALGFQPGKLGATVYSVLSGAARAKDAIRPVAGTLWLMPTTIDLAGGEAELAARPRAHFILREAMAEIGDSEYDFAIVDSPPQLGFLNINSLAWVREVFIPVQCEFYALHGLSLLMNTVERIRAQFNPGLQISAVIPCQVNPRRALTRDVLAELERHFPGRVTKTRIRVNVRLAEAPSHGMSIFDYAPESNGAIDYGSLAEEVLQLPPPTALAAAPAPAPAAVVSTPPEPEPIVVLPELPEPEPVAPEPGAVVPSFAVPEGAALVGKAMEGKPEPVAAAPEAPPSIAPEPELEPVPIVEVQVTPPAPEPSPVAPEAQPVTALATPLAPAAKDPRAVLAPDTLGGKLALSGLKPIVVAKPGGKTEEAGEEKGGGFLGHRFFGMLFSRKE